MQPSLLTIPIEYFEEPSVYMFTGAPSIFSAFIVPNDVSLAPIIRPCRIQEYTLDPKDLVGVKAIAGLHFAKDYVIYFVV